MSEMHRHQNPCKWCGTNDVQLLGYAMKAPWVTRDKPQAKTSLAFCTKCELVFFTSGWTETQLNAIYDDYRGSNYVARRRRWEPWYTARLNESIGHSPYIENHRRSELAELLHRSLTPEQLNAIQTAVDFGGDEGQFLPDLPALEHKFVYEVSGVRTRQGIAKLETEDEVVNVQPDLVLVCHVIEHLNEPGQFVKHMHSQLKPGTLVYFEVPLDRPPKPPRFFLTAHYKRFVEAAWKVRPLWILLDFVSQVGKAVLNRQLIFSVLKQSEHVSFFDQASLLAGLQDHGYTLIAENEYVIQDPNLGRRFLVRALGVLVRV
jgi:hypothetical protein